MKLSFSQIKEITSGAERVYEKDGTVCFFRFTEKEEALYSAPEGRRLRAVSTPGISLKFKIDASGLKLGVTVREKARPYFSVEVFSIGQKKRLPIAAASFGRKSAGSIRLQRKFS